MLSTVYKDIISHLLMGDARDLTSEVIYNINNVTLMLLNKSDLSASEIDIMGDIIHISNIIYNNTDRSILVLEDGVYDLLLQKYKRYNPNYQVGAEPVNIDLDVNIGTNTCGAVQQGVSPFVKMNPIDKNNMLFYNDLNKHCDMTMITYNDSHTKISKRLRNSAHKYPSLVGTLDKAKFVLDSDAIARGVYDNPAVCIFERDFLRDHIERGIVDPNNITLVLELKYDGVSVEAEVANEVISARTRGDTGIGKATDITPIFKGYPFKGTSGFNIEPFGMKFEAIINNYNLQLLNREKGGKNYANPRNAVIGILGNSDAPNLSRYITLVPLATSLSGMNRIEEIEFMNKYYSTGECCRYAVVTGNYHTVLFQVKKFVEEAEMMRDYLPFMYDGVVVSYLDASVRRTLGRKNHVNKYSIAIKFNTKKKLTRIRNMTFTVGSTGVITPMYYYDPIEFYGNIQTKSSGHSYGEFKNNYLRPGDVIECEYRNDVMNYVTKANIIDNDYNPNPPFAFPTVCPECGSTIEFSSSYDSAYCPNFECKGRTVARVTNMLNKLGFKGFAEETVRKLNITSFHDLMNMTFERARILGDGNADNLMIALDDFLATPVLDYNILGSLGFTGIASATWKKILSEVSLKDIISLNDFTIVGRLSNIKGIGYITADTITTERKYFMKDLLFIYNNIPKIIITKGDNEETLTMRKVIRFSGIRNTELMNELSMLGHDCSEGSVTKKTDILIVPFLGFDSTKTRTAEKYRSEGINIKIIPHDEFKLNRDTYLGEI